MLSIPSDNTTIEGIEGIAFTEVCSKVCSTLKYVVKYVVHTEGIGFNPFSTATWADRRVGVGWG